MAQENQGTKEDKNLKLRSRGAADEGVPENAWHRLHPLTPIISTFSLFVVIILAVFWGGFGAGTQLLSDPIVREQVFEILASGENFEDIADILYAIVVVVILLIILIAQIIYNYVNWRFTAYAVTDAAVWYRTGVVNRKQQHARLERIQTVDITHPLLGRIFGLGSLSVEVAGGSDSKLLFGFLKTSELERLRAEILARAAGIYRDGQASSSAVADKSGVGARDTETVVPEIDNENKVDNKSAESTAGASNHSHKLFLQTAPERQVFQLSTGRLLGSTALNGIFILILLIVVVAIVVCVALVVFIPEAFLGLLIAGFSIAIVYISLVWTNFSALFGFKVALSADGIRIYRGLLQTVAQTILPKRIHAVEITQPLLWRKLGWYQVKLLQAGVSAATTEKSGNNQQQMDTIRNIFMPAATREEALLALWLVLPDLGTDIEPNELFDQCFISPQKARKTAANPQTNAQRLFRISPPAAKILDPIIYGRRAVAFTDTSLLIRGGWISRWTSFVPFEHVQSFAVKRGPLQHWRGLASVHVHLVPGQIHSAIRHLHDLDALAASREIERRSRIRRAAQGPERWLSMLQEEQDEKRNDSK